MKECNPAIGDLLKSFRVQYGEEEIYNEQQKDNEHHEISHILEPPA
jgi:hypothetical protein